MRINISDDLVSEAHQISIRQNRETPNTLKTALKLGLRAMREGASGVESTEHHRTSDNDIAEFLRSLADVRKKPARLTAEIEHHLSSTVPRSHPELYQYLKAHGDNIKRLYDGTEQPEGPITDAMNG